jgi:hypothetical protein
MEKNKVRYRAMTSKMFREGASINEKKMFDALIHKAIVANVMQTISLEKVFEGYVIKNVVVSASPGIKKGGANSRNSSPSKAAIARLANLRDKNSISGITADVAIKRIAAGYVGRCFSDIFRDVFDSRRRENRLLKCEGK